MVSKTGQRLKRKKQKIIINMDPPGGFEGKTCLIIGDGPTKDLIDMNAKYDVDVIIGVHYILHRYTNIVCSTDITLFEDKELQVLNKNIPLILNYHCANLLNDSIVQKPTYVKLIDGCNSGIFAIQWANYKKFDTIYTAGIDLKAGYIQDAVFIPIHKKIINNLSSELFKASYESTLECPIQIPEKQ